MYFVFSIFLYLKYNFQPLSMDIKQGTVLLSCVTIASGFYTEEPPEAFLFCGP
jgi:hypothetical protein